MGANHPKHHPIAPSASGSALIITDAQPVCPTTDFLSVLGHGFWPEQRPEVSIRAVFRSRPPWRLIGSRRGEERREPQTDSGRALLAYKHWDLKNPFAKIEPPLQNEPQIRYLLLSDIRRLLGYLKVRQQGYGSALAFNLANSLFQTACRFDELIRLTWADCQRVGEEIVALRIKGRGRLPGCAGYRCPSTPPKFPKHGLFQ